MTGEQRSLTCGVRVLPPQGFTADEVRLRELLLWCPSLRRIELRPLGPESAPVTPSAVRLRTLARQAALALRLWVRVEAATDADGRYGARHGTVICVDRRTLARMPAHRLRQLVDAAHDSAVDP